MEHAWLLTILIMTITSGGEAYSMFEWVWGNSKDETTVLVADGVPLISIPYESMTEDEKFLQEAAKFTEIQVSSPLETCQHKVIMKIRTACSQMTEEELAKLSVNLLNCQSAVEGRKMFPCTEEMSLKQCTTDMDADMWNAYHLMSNRARAVCYAARSTQFRALSELTVNKLMETAHVQIKTLDSLKISQDQLEEQQQHLMDAQTSAHNLVTTNLRELINERALIKIGHSQLTSMTEDIRKKLEEASQKLEQQAIERSGNHREILNDLTNIQEQAQLIWDKIETSTNRIFTQHEMALDQYEQTLERLARINETIQFIWNLTNTMRTEVDQKLNWLTNYIGDTGEQMHRMYRVGLHIIYLLCAMIIASFLYAPFLTRITIMGIVPLNLVSYLRHGMEACLDFPSMTILIFLITTMHFLMVGIQRIFGPKTTTARSEPVQVINQNGHANGNTQAYVLSSNTNLKSPRIPAVSLYAKLKKMTRKLYDIVSCQISQFIQKCSFLVQSIIYCSRQDKVQREELSCTYVSSKKPREDLVYNYPHEFPSMSEDVTDFENSNATNKSDVNLDDFDMMLDAQELRRRLNAIENSIGRSSRSHQASPSRSVSSKTSGTPKFQCKAITKSGWKCRLNAVGGHLYCSIHSSGRSNMGD